MYKQQKLKRPYLPTLVVCNESLISRNARDLLYTPEVGKSVCVFFVPTHEPRITLRLRLIYMLTLEGLKLNDPFVKSLPVEWHGALNSVTMIIIGLLRHPPLAVLFVVR